VTGPIRDTGQNVLQSAFVTGSSSSHSYCNIGWLIAFLEEAIINNIIIVIYINYKVIIFVNNNALFKAIYGRL
jgi:hypothetical protein